MLARLWLGILSGVAGADPLRPYIDAALEGDDAAVGELVRLTQPAVWQVCGALGSTGEVEDLVQETYCTAGAACGCCRCPRYPAVAAPRCGCDSAHDDLVAGLDADRREAFVLTQLVGLSYEEAAAVVGCPIGTIRSRVARARADLLAVVAHADAR